MSHTALLAPFSGRKKVQQLVILDGETSLPRVAESKTQAQAEVSDAIVAYTRLALLNRTWSFSPGMAKKEGVLSEPFFGNKVRPAELFGT